VGDLRPITSACEAMSASGALGAVVIGWGLLNGLMFLAQPGIIFHPYPQLDATPKDWGLDYTDVSLQAEDGVRLHGWFVPRAGARRVLLFFHGNAGNISHRGESIAIFHRLGLAVFIIDYRGFGHSEGSPSENGLYRDARAAWRHLTEVRGIAPEDIVIFGRSLGGVVAAHLASEVHPAGLIVESSFSSATDASHAIFPLLSRLVILRYRFDAAKAMWGVRCPVLVLHSPEDDVIPYALGRKLYDSALSPKRFVELRGGHNGGFLLSQPDYEQALQDFVAALPGRAG
jgi:fermentation-respiration switch protein FrsA (DUF1100 family)